MELDDARALEHEPVMSDYKVPPWLLPSCYELFQTEIQPNANRIVKRVRLLRHSLDTAWRVRKNRPRAQFLEFGVHRGVDISLLADFLVTKAEQSKCDAPKIDGFDSFKGLPHDWENGQTSLEGGPLFEKGHFDLGGEPPVLANGNVELHAGWFEDTVAPFFEEHSQPAAFVHADADLYSSTLVFLEELGRRQLLVKGTVITFDEYWNYPGWEDGEYRAWLEVSKRYGIKYCYLNYHAPSEMRDSRPLDVNMIDIDPTVARDEFFKRKLWKHGFMSVSVMLTAVDTS